MISQKTLMPTRSPDLRVQRADASGPYLLEDPVRGASTNSANTNTSC
jgi:hypothetical protein